MMRLEEFNQRFDELVRSSGAECQGLLILNDGRSFTINGMHIGEDPSNPKTWHATQELLCMALHILYAQREEYMREAFARQQAQAAQQAALQEAANQPLQ
jgi:hypothetical protein